MKKLHKIRHGALAGLALALGLGAAPIASAELLLNEDFSSCTLGNLYKQNGWVRKQGTVSEGEDIKIEAFSLSYPGYCSAGTTNAATIRKSSKSQESLKKKFRDKTDSTDPVYYAFLLNPTDIPTVSSPSYLFSFITGSSNATEVEDNKGCDEHGRVFVYKQSGDADNAYRIGFSKYGGAMQAKTTDQAFNLNETVLIVCKWVWVEGTTNDYFEFWVNPTKSSTEPTAHYTSATTGSDVVVGTSKKPLQGIEICQGGGGKTPAGHIGAIKVATSWADLWEEGDTPVIPVETPVISTSNNILRMASYQGMEVKTVESVRVYGKNLKSDITVSGLTHAVPSVTTIPKEEAMSEEGYCLTVTLQNDAPLSPTTETMKLESEDATPMNVRVEEVVYEVTQKPMLSGLNNLSDNDYNIYNYTGEATVTFVDTQNGIIYAQDATGGIKLSVASFIPAPNIKRGDKLTGILCTVGDAYGGHSILPLRGDVGTLVSENNEVEPIEVALSEFNSQRETYLSRVVKVNDVTFTRAGEAFATATTPIKSEGADGFVRAFPGTEMVGVEIPASAAAVIGIPTSASASIISMRDKEDLLETPAAIEVSTEAVADKNVWKEVGQEYVHSKVTIKSTALKQPASVWLSGADRSHFSIDKDEIPVGNAETVITVTYTPTARGTHSATLTIDAVPTELSQTVKLTDKAWDPSNPPSITVAAENLKEFEANVGDSQEQTISYTTSGLLDYGSVKVEQEVAGTFLISNGSLMKDGTFNIKITFAPKAEGSYSATLKFEAEKAEPKILIVNGKTTGYREPEQKQGDELAFDTSNPHAYLTENFENAGANNSPLSIPEWKNVAVTGTRAWWGCTFEEEYNSAAKVTAYDSFAEEETPCEMLLLSPALSFEKATDKVLAFKLMGQYLSEGQPEQFDVVYVDATDPENPYYEPIQGLNIPATSDYNNQWVPYVIDLNSQDLAEPFFIGFRFKSNRGRNSAATYFVDDFSWGKDDVAHISASKTSWQLNAQEGSAFVSDPIELTGHNLAGSIALSLEGEQGDAFSVEPATLPATGGSFTLKADSLKKGAYALVVKATAEDAPSLILNITVNVSESGIDGIYADTTDRADVYTVSGVLVGRQMTRTEAKSHLAPGLYIHGTTKLIVK